MLTIWHNERPPHKECGGRQISSSRTPGTCPTWKMADFSPFGSVRIGPVHILIPALAGVPRLAKLFGTLDALAACQALFAKAAALASSPALSPLGPPAEPAEHHPCRGNRLAADSQDHGGYRNAGQSPTPNRHLRRKRPVLTSPSPVNAVDDDRDWSSGTVGGALSDDHPHRGNAANVSALTIIRWGFTWFSRGIIPQYWHRQVLL